MQLNQYKLLFSRLKLFETFTKLYNLNSITFSLLQLITILISHTLTTLILTLTNMANQWFFSPGSKMESSFRV